MAFTFTERQDEVQTWLMGPERHKLIYGGARSGKTFIIVRNIVARAMIAPGSRHLITRYRQNAVRASIGLDTLPRVMALCFPGVPLTEYRQDNIFELPNGAQLWLLGLDEKQRVDKILGTEFATLFLNECSQITRSSVTTVRTRLAQRSDIVVDGKSLRRPLPQRAYYDLNPVGSLHWSNQEFIRKVDPDSKRPVANPEWFAYTTMNPVDNKANLSKATIAELEALPERARKRFYEGVFVNDVEGALWPAEVIEASRVQEDARLPDFHRTVVAVDPSGTRGDVEPGKNRPGRSDSVGIVVASTGADGKCYIRADRTVNLPPEAWARVAINAYHEFEADCLVAEINFGGAMVESVIRGVDQTVSYKEVTASRGKWVRAEPVSALYAKDLVRHVGRFPDLEDEMENFSASGYVGPRSPDRADALVWAVTELMLGEGFDAETYLKAWS